MLVLPPMSPYLETHSHHSDHTRPAALTFDSTIWHGILLMHWETNTVVSKRAAFLGSQCLFLIKDDAASHLVFWCGGPLTPKPHRKTGRNVGRAVNAVVVFHLISQTFH